MLSENWERYVDCEYIWRIAREHSHGIVLKCESGNVALHMRTRLNKYKYMDREVSAERWPVGHSLHGLSLYDAFTVLVRGKEIWIKRDVPAYELEERNVVDFPTPEYQDIGEAKPPNPNAIAPSDVLDRMIEEKEAKEGLGKVMAEIKPTGFKRRI